MWLVWTSGWAAGGGGWGGCQEVGVGRAWVQERLGGGGVEGEGGGGEGEGRGDFSDQKLSFPQFENSNLNLYVTSSTDFCVPLGEK